MRHLDLFSGIGGFALAASRTWGDEYKNVGHCEIEEYACKVYHKHFPDSKCLGDITKVKWNEGQADIITGGFPCQPHSQAGKRLASKDERDLWYECKRAVSEIRPRYALFENVSGLLTSERGGFFNRVLSDLAEIGYDAEWTSISASEIGAPHKRERIWIVAHTKSIRLEKIKIFKGDITKNNIEKPKEWEQLLTISTGNYYMENWENFESIICEYDNGIPDGLGAALKGYGNAIVPQVAQIIMEAIKEDDEHTDKHL